MRKAVLFDWNGTLLDDIPVWYDSVKEIFRVYEKTPPTMEEYFREWEGDYLKIYQSRGITVSREEMNKVYGLYYEAHVKTAVLNFRAKEVLSNLFLRKNTFVGLITAQPRELVVPLLDKFDIGGFFLYRAFHVLDKKETIRRLLKREDIDPKNCYYVGDTPSDMRHAKKAGVVAVSFLNGYVPEDLIMNSAPDFIIRNLEEILKIV